MMHYMLIDSEDIYNFSKKYIYFKYIFSFEKLGGKSVYLYKSI